MIPFSIKFLLYRSQLTNFHQSHQLADNRSSHRNGSRPSKRYQLLQLWRHLGQSLLLTNPVLSSLHAWSTCLKCTSTYSSILTQLSFYLFYSSQSLIQFYFNLDHPQGQPSIGLIGGFYFPQSIRMFRIYLIPYYTRPLFFCFGPQNSNIYI